MKERGMIFNAEMVRAILDGRKTQTRRPVKFPVLDKNLGCELAGNELAGELSAGNYLNSAFGKPGDRIWVRETWQAIHAIAMKTGTSTNADMHEAFRGIAGTTGIRSMKRHGAMKAERTANSLGDHLSTCRAGPAAFCWKSPACGLSAYAA